jgi:hypothetical protein
MKINFLQFESLAPGRKFTKVELYHHRVKLFQENALLEDKYFIVELGES